MAWIWISSLLVVSILYFLEQLNYLFKNKKQPPGPVRLPIIGHFHLLGKNPHQDLHRLARKYGPIMSMRFGSIPTIIVSSPAAVELFFKKYDLVFANRPHHEAASYLSYGQRNVVFAQYGPYWRDMRKLCTLELLSNLKIGQFRSTREREVGILIGALREASDRSEVVDMSMKIASLSADITCLMVFGKKYGDSDLDEKGFKKVIKEAVTEAGAFNLGDYFPYLRGLDLQGSTRRLKNLSKIFDGFLERIIDEHAHEKAEKQQQAPDFVDTLMAILESGRAGFDLDRRHVKAVLLDMLLAGMDTTAATIEWTLSEILKNPIVQTKIQDELANHVGRDCMVEESHLPKLKYLDYVIRESMRLHPPVPMLINESMEDCEVNGYYIPKRTRVLTNVWAIGRDLDAWKDPETFSPDRFDKNDVDVRGQDFQLIPFGTGRRGCPGMQLGLTMVQLAMAQLVHCFDWNLPRGMLPEDLDMDEYFGLITSRANHLMACPSYRLYR